MGLGVRIDFREVYKLESVSEDLRVSSFKTQLKDGSSVLLTVRINDDPHELLSNVYNLAFGVLDKRGRMDDKAELPHVDYSRLFSTILLCALKYLKKNPGHHIGMDGSENRRAWYYWRILQRNYEYLSKRFEMYGLKYYVRISRFGKYQYDNPFDFDDVQAQPEEIFKVNEWPEHMYNYFVFNLKYRPEALLQ